MDKIPLGAIQISDHQVRAYSYLKTNPKKWVLSKELARGAKMAPRTGRHIMTIFRHYGIVEEALVYPGPRYRWNSNQEQMDKSYLERLEAALTIVNSTKSTPGTNI